MLMGEFRGSEMGVSTRHVPAPFTMEQATIVTFSWRTAMVGALLGDVDGAGESLLVAV
jgi:hypothetical protein